MFYLGCRISGDRKNYEENCKLSVEYLGCSTSSEM